MNSIFKNIYIWSPLVSAHCKYTTYVFNFKIFLLMCVYLCMYMLHVCGCHWRLEEGASHSVAGIIGSCKLPEVSAGDQTWVL